MRKLVFIFLAATLLSCSGGTKSSSTTATEQTVQTPKIEVVSHNVKQDEYGTTVYAVVKNNTDKSASYIDIQAFFYDAQGDTIGSGLGNATNIDGGATKTIEILCADDVKAATQYKVELGNVMW